MMTLARAAAFTIGLALGAATVLTAFAGPAAAKDIWTQINETAPRSPFDRIADSAPRSPFDRIGDNAPRSAGPEEDRLVGE